MSDTGSPMLTARHIKSVWLSDLAAFIGEVARPIAIISTSLSASWGVLVLAGKVNSPEAAVFCGAVFLGVGTLYGVKGWEKVVQARGDAEVRKEAAKTG